MTELSLNEINSHPDYRVLRRVPERFTPVTSTDSKRFMATIIDLETMGMNAKSDAILEIALLSFSFSNTDGIVAVTDTYNELQDPGLPIPAEITRITGITDDAVKGHAIEWNRVLEILNNSHVIICHNSRFDRNFLELQTPEDVRRVVESKPFGCTIQDIDWKSRGYESSKLEYLNFKMGFFYEGHRALVDCWATLNLLIQESGAFDELKASVRRKESLLCAVNTAFDKKDLLKARSYRWSDGTSSLPKCWWTVIPNELLEEEKKWLDEDVYGRAGGSSSLPVLEITAFKRYSFRAEQLA